MKKKYQEILRVCTSHEMREIDRIAETQFGIDPFLLMENAGRAASQALLESYPTAGAETEVLIFAGKGNNAGDAFVVARRLIGLGRRVRVFCIEPSTHYPEAVQKNFDILKRLGARILLLDEIKTLHSFLAQSQGPFTVVDGLLGTGIKGNLAGIYHDAVEMINSMNAREVISLDIPTGVSGDTGAILGTAIQATLTVSFGCPKLGHFLPPGAAKRGSLINVDISLPHVTRAEGDKFLLLKQPMSALLEERDRYGHKNSFGHTLLIGGSPGRVGAIAMSANACHRVGTGLVTVSSWKDSIDLLMAKIPNETMAFPIALEGKEIEGYSQNQGTYSSVVIGPGLGLRPEGKQLLEEVLARYQGPLVIDADALNMISDHDLFDLLATRRSPTVLTPHPGEMARLLKISKEEVMDDVLGCLKKAVEKTNSIVLLKGAATLISSPEHKVYLNHYPNDGMATAGSGDVLAGMIGGLLGQKMDPFQATLLGVYLHSVAGGLASDRLGHRSMTAPDIIENIPFAFKEIKNYEAPSVPIEGRAHLL